jgi:class 3 adenylate cyclase
VERFADLYLDKTAGALRPVSVLFADLEGFTEYSAGTDPGDVSAMLEAYWGVGVPAIADNGGEVGKLIGDAIMAVFNERGDQPDHAERAVRAGLAFQVAAGRLAREHPDWPRFRVGVNTGEAHVGVVGTAEHREYAALGDVVNTASRLEGEAGVGQVVIGATTYEELPDGTAVDPLGGLRVKGKDAPVEAYVVVGLPPER